MSTESDPTIERSTIVIGYTHQDMSDCGGLCPCKDPGNYVAFEITGMDLVIQCWCGRTRAATFDSPAERAAFLLKHRAVDAS